MRRLPTRAWPGKYPQAGKADEAASGGAGSVGAEPAVFTDPDATPAEASAAAAVGGSGGDSKPAVPTRKRNPVSHALNENFATEELIDELRNKELFGKRGEVALVAQVRHSHVGPVDTCVCGLPHHVLPRAPCCAMSGPATRSSSSSTNLLPNVLPCTTTADYRRNHASVDMRHLIMRHLIPTSPLDHLIMRHSIMRHFAT